MRKTFYWKNEQVSATFSEQKRIAHNLLTNTEQTNYRWFFGILQTNTSNFFENSKGSTRYVSSRNNFVKAIFWFLCGCFYTFFAWSQRFKSGCFLFKRNKNFWISFESNGNVVRKMTLVTDVSGRIDQIWLGFGCYMKTFCVSWPDVRYAYLSQYIEYIFCMRFQTV